MLGVIITGALCAVFIVLSAILLSGHGEMLIAGYNTAKRKKRQSMMKKALPLNRSIYTFLRRYACGIMLCRIFC